MITKMTKFSIIMMSGDTDKILEQIQQIGLLDISRSTKPVDAESSLMVERASEIRRNINLILKDDCSRDEDWKQYTAELSALEKEYRYRQIWGDYDRQKMEELERKGYKFHFHTIPTKKFDCQWESEYALQVIQDDGKEIRFVTVTDEEPYQLKAGQCKAPDGPSGETAAAIADLKLKIQQREAILSKEKDLVPRLEKELRDITGNFDRYLAGKASSQAAEGKITVFIGFAPTEDETSVSKALDALDIYYIKEAATKEDRPPIKLKNRGFAKLFETLTGMYGMPVYDEFDPTPILAPFFLLFWAFCMGDAGYGILLLGVSLLLKKTDILGLQNHRGLVSMLGVGTIIIGLILGTLFGINLYQAVWVPDICKKCMVAGQLTVGGVNYDVQMVAALAIGIFHICLALVVKAIGTTKRYGVKEAVSIWGWVILIIGAILTAASSMTGMFGADATKWAIIVIGAVSFFTIFVFNKPGRNPLLNIGAGLWDTYGMATGILGDVLSYIRIYALGLAGGMLGGAFNTLAGMTIEGAAQPTWQYLPFALILIFGHTLNFAMSCLGAFVHPLRLTFVEYFKNSGYEGKGSKYNPLSINNNKQ